ncbi:MAG: TolC family protein [Alistipes sp.]|nr:TolC family protein [Alistipes sp.]
MSFSEAMNVMFENNSMVKSEQYNVDMAYNELRATRGLALPKIDLIGGYTFMQSDIDMDLGGSKGVITESLKDAINQGVTNGIISSDLASLLTQGLSPITSMDWRYTLQKRSFGVVGATLTLPIYMGGRINIANRAARIALSAASYSLDATKSMLLTELVERYYGVVVARSACAVRQDVVDAIKRHLVDAKAMEEEGIVAHSVVVYAQYKLAEAERDLHDAINKVKVAEAALNTTVGIEQSINPIDIIFICNNIHNIDYYTDMAIALNPILCELRHSKQLSEEGVKLARAAMLPEIVAMGAGAIYSHQLSNMIPRWSIGVGVRIPLFDGLGKEYRYIASKSGVKSVKEEVENAQSNIILLVEKEYYNLENTMSNISATRRAIDFAESYYNSALEGFREGVVSSADLMDACTELAATKVEYLNAAYENTLTLARLLEASGLSDTFIQYVEQGTNIDI